MSATPDPDADADEHAILAFCETHFGSNGLLTQLAAVDESTDEVASISEVAEWDNVNSSDPETGDLFRAWYTYIVHQLVDAANRDVLETLLAELDVERPGHDLPEADRPHTEIKEEEVRQVVANLEELFGPESAIVEKTVKELSPTGQADITEVIDDISEQFDSSLDPHLGKAGALADALAMFYTSAYRLYIAG